MFGMRFLRSGRKRRERPPAAGDPAAPPLTTVRVAAPNLERELSRRDTVLTFDRLFLPSLILDHTELMIRQHGVYGEEGFGLWAGTLAGGDAFISTLVVPGIQQSRRLHGEIDPETAAAVFETLDRYDLVPVAQIHSHPQRAFLSPTDAERPLVAVRGFLSIVVPSFGFVDLADVDQWRVYSFERRDHWIELDHSERRRRLIIDPSILRIDRS
jgi:hypothetical protein